MFLRIEEERMKGNNKCSSRQKRTRSWRREREEMREKESERERTKLEERERGSEREGTGEEEKWSEMDLLRVWMKKEESHCFKAIVWCMHKKYV